MLLTGVIVLPGCKPTEKNYKAAYDAALAKRTYENNDPDLNLPSSGYQKIGGPERKKIGDRSYDYLFMRLKPLNEGAEMQQYNVAVSVYKMPTNCESQVKDLQSVGYSSFGAKSGDDRYYVIVGTYPTIEEAAACADEYMKGNKDAFYVGFAGGPVIIRSK